MPPQSQQSIRVINIVLFIVLQINIGCEHNAGCVILYIDIFTVISHKLLLLFT